MSPSKTKTRNRVRELRMVPASELRGDPRNWRTHPDDQRSALRGVLDRIGIADAVLAREVDGELVIIDGHVRTDLLAGEQEVPVLIVDVDEQEAGELLATLDPIAAMARADEAALGTLLETDDESWRALLEEVHDLPAPVIPDADHVVDPVPNPVAERGQVWLLGGRHRLMCGDSTDPQDVHQLLDGASPNLLVTDPPYGVDYDPAWRDAIGYAAGRARGKPVGDDDEGLGWRLALPLFDGDVAYVWHAALRVLEVASGLKDAGFDLRAQIVWSKGSAGLARGHYGWAHEPCFYAVRKGGTASWRGPKNAITVWEIARNRKNETGHSTQKPVECMARPIRHHEGDVYDPFVGAGATIIAAEQERRVCYAMEIDPGFIDATLARWELLFGTEAKRLV